MKALRDTALNPLLAMGVCVLGGAACSRLGAPLPWIIGPLLVMALFNFSGASLRAPPGVRPAGQVIIGAALGLYFTPVVARELVAFWHLLVMSALLAIGIGVACAVFLRRVTGVDSATAFFASVPGGAAEMAVLAERFGGRVDRVAIAQSLRILVVVIVIPFGLTYSGVHGTDAYLPATNIIDWAGLVLLLALATAGGGVLAAARTPNAFVLGPLFMVIGLTVSELSFSAMPPLVSNLGQLFIGCALGARFEQRFVQGVPRFLAGVLGSLVLALLLAACAALGLAWAYGLPAPSLILATAPGGIAEMCITAKVLQLGVPLVTAAHVTRVIVLVTCTGPLFAATQRHAQSRGKS